MYDLHHQRLHSFTCIDSTFILVAQINVKWTVCVDRQYIYKYFTYYVTISAYTSPLSQALLSWQSHHVCYHIHSTAMHIVLYYYGQLWLP